VRVVALLRQRLGPLEGTARAYHVAALPVQLAVQDLGDRGEQGAERGPDRVGVGDRGPGVVELTEPQVRFRLVGERQRGEEPVAGPGLQGQFRFGDGERAGAVLQRARAQVRVDPG
jgi:hypothetical protein